MDELYEAYCIQRRLCDGASKMKQAFAMSPASKAARESLTEINRSYKEYTEVHQFILLTLTLFESRGNFATNFREGRRNKSKLSKEEFVFVFLQMNT